MRATSDIVPAGEKGQSSRERGTKDGIVARIWKSFRRASRIGDPRFRASDADRVAIRGKWANFRTTRTIFPRVVKVYARPSRSLALRESRDYVIDWFSEVKIETRSGNEPEYSVRDYVKRVRMPRG